MRLPRVFAAVQLAVAAVVDARELHHGPFGELETNPSGDSGAAVEILLEGDGAVVPLFGEVGGEREERRERQDLVVDGEAIADRPAPPGQQRAEGVVVAEGGGAGGDVEVRPPGQIDADGAKLLADPRVQGGVGDGVLRRPERIGVLARCTEKELPGAQLEVLGVDVDVGFHEPGALAAGALLIVPRRAVRVKIEPR